MGPQIGDLRRGVDIIVGTPGRIIDHISNGHLNLVSYFLSSKRGWVVDTGPVCFEFEFEFKLHSLLCSVQKRFVCLRPLQNTAPCSMVFLSRYVQIMSCCVPRWWRMKCQGVPFETPPPLTVQVQWQLYQHRSECFKTQ